MSVEAAEVIADLLARGHSVRFRATGHSMHPIIRSDDYLLVEPVSSVAPGDVVLVLAERGLTAHRVVVLDGGGMIVTRGDNAPGPDDAVDATRVLGLVTHAERNGRMRPIRRAGRATVALIRFALRVLGRFVR